VAKLRSDQCWQVVGEIDISPALAELDAIPFKMRNVGSTNPNKLECPVVPAGARLPQGLEIVIDAALAVLGGEPARFVVRKLAQRQSIGPHIDSLLPEEYDWRRFQLPLVTDPRIIMRWPDDGQELHLRAGILYEVRADRTHEVVNPAEIERIHLQLDQINATV
jgi:hypothetical protein